MDQGAETGFNWTRLSCHKFIDNQVRLALFVLAYNLGNFMRRLALPEGVKHRSLTSLQSRIINTGRHLVRHARRLVFQLAEVLVSREMMTGMLERIDQPSSVTGWLTVGSTLVSATGSWRPNGSSPGRNLG